MHVIGNYQKDKWNEIHEDLKEAIQDGRLTLDEHADEQGETRQITTLDTALTILCGKIIECHDAGEYKVFGTTPNRLPQLTIVGEVNGRTIAAIVFMLPHYQYSVITVYELEVTCKKYNKYMSA